MTSELATQPEPKKINLSLIKGELLDSNLTNIAAAELVRNTRTAKKLRIEWDVDSDAGFVAVRNEVQDTVVQIPNRQALFKLMMDVTGYRVKKDFAIQSGINTMFYCGFDGSYLRILFGCSVAYCPLCEFYITQGAIWDEQVPQLVK